MCMLHLRSLSGGTSSMAVMTDFMAGAYGADSHGAGTGSNEAVPGTSLSTRRRPGTDAPRLDDVEQSRALPRSVVSNRTLDRPTRWPAG